MFRRNGLIAHGAHNAPISLRVYHYWLRKFRRLIYELTFMRKNVSRSRVLSSGECHREKTKTERTSTALKYHNTKRGTTNYSMKRNKLIISREWWHIVCTQLAIFRSVSAYTYAPRRKHGGSFSSRCTLW